MAGSIVTTLSSIPPNENIGERYSWVDVDAPGNNNLFARLVYVVNANDISGGGGGGNVDFTTTNNLLSSILVALDGVLLVD